MPSVVGTLAVVVVALAAAIVVLLWLLMRRTRGPGPSVNAKTGFVASRRVPHMHDLVGEAATLDYLNSTCVAFSGRSLQQLLDEGWLDSVHPEDVEHCLRTYGPAFEARTPFLGSDRLRRADGVYRWILDTGVPKYQPDGTFPDTSAAASTSLNAGRARRGYARTGPRSRSAIGRFNIWPDV